MKSNIRYFMVALLAFSFSSAYAVDTSENTANYTTANVPSNAAPNKVLNYQQAENKAQNKDAETIGWLMVLNKNEMEAANVASKKQISPVVKKYASMLRKEHNKNLQDTLKVSRKIGQPPAETEVVILMKKKGQEQLAILQPLNNQQFQAVFIDEIVKGHTEALNKIDQAMPNISNPVLKQHLQATRAHIEKHLQMGKQIQNKVLSSS